MTAEGPTGAPLRQQIAEAIHKVAWDAESAPFPLDFLRADAVLALLNLTEERRETPDLGEWRPDCGGDWCLGGGRWFANYWPDNTVSASIYAGEDGDEDALANSGIMSGKSRADCQHQAEEWIRAQLAPATRYVTPWLPSHHTDPETATQTCGGCGSRASQTTGVPCGVCGLHP